MKKKKTTSQSFISKFAKIGILLAVFAAVFMLGTTQAQAASTKTKAIKAYNSLLSKKTLTWSKNLTVKTSKCKFALIYVDNNSVPELFVDASRAGTNHVSGFQRLYTYQNGKVKEVMTVRDGFGYYRKKGVITSYTALHGEYLSHFKLASGKAKLQLRKETYYTTEYYNGSEKKISKSTYQKILKKLIGSSKPTKIHVKANTSANRKKYLK